MDDFYMFNPFEAERNPMSDARWWFLLDDKQKKQHLFIDSKLELKDIKLLLRIYGEETLIKKEADKDS